MHSQEVIVGLCRVPALGARCCPEQAVPSQAHKAPVAETACAV